MIEPERAALFLRGGRAGDDQCDAKSIVTAARNCLPDKLQVRIKPPNVFSFSVSVAAMDSNGSAEDRPCQQATRFLPALSRKTTTAIWFPLIFESYAEDIAQRVAALSPNAVLETAAGSGVVTRALVPGLSPDASYVVTDLNQPMLDYAAARQASRRSHQLAPGGCTGAAVRRCCLRSGVLPVRRHVLP